MTGILCALAGAGGSAPPVALTDTFTIPTRSTYVPGDKFTFSQSAGGPIAFPVRNGATFKISMYGAGGGNFSGAGSGGNANGGILIVNINLSYYQNTNLFFYKGGGGDNSISSIDQCYGGFAGGFNGGGSGAGSRGPGGGGRTDLRITAGSPFSELLVAGGGGGGYGALSTGGSRFQGASGCGDMFGDYCGDNAGGGGGYQGGSASCGDDDSNGGPGSNFFNASRTTLVIQNTTITGQTGGNSGDGYFIVEVLTV